SGSLSARDDPLGANGTDAVGISDAGQVVGSYFDGSNHLHGFLYRGGNYTPLDDLLGVNGTVATGINAAGQIVGYYFDASNHPHGFIYTGGKKHTTPRDTPCVYGHPGNGINPS